MSGNLPNVPVNCLAVDNDNGVYAGTDIGVFYRSPTMSNWMPWSNGLPNVPVTELVIYDDGSIKRIRAATFGRGVWSAIPASDCDASVVVTGNLEGVRHYEASSMISSTSTFVEGGIGTYVSFKSGDHITLGEGFIVKDESVFLGFISPCGTGGIPVQGGGETSGLRMDGGASVIPLRRMYDPEDGLPYGAVEAIRHTQDQIHMEFRIKGDGEVRLFAANGMQHALHNLYTGELPAGRHDLTVQTSHLKPEFQYLLLFYEGQLAHFEELDLRVKTEKVVTGGK
jgi:hypothetical protein